MKVKTGYTFDDVLLIPKYSEIKSRTDVNLSVDLGKGVKLKIPIVSANMLNVTGPEMAAAMCAAGGLPILHRFGNENIYELAVKSCGNISQIGASIGVQDSDKRRVGQLVDQGCRIICIDVAHGASRACREMTEYVASKYPHVLLIAGNVATPLGAKLLADGGADVIKVGIGGGSLCTTRIETGNGVPQLTALADVYERRERFQAKYKIIADGGIRTAGDICKALCFADVVMLGNVLAGTNEAPGEIRNIDGRDYKEYVGSSTHKNRHIEGVRAMVPCKGPVSDVLDHLMAGLRSGCSYQGANNLAELREDPEFVTISSAGLKESHPHDVFVKV